jgi:hypothetical protein
MEVIDTIADLLKQAKQLKAQLDTTVDILEQLVCVCSVT